MVATVAKAPVGGENVVSKGIDAKILHFYRNVKWKRYGSEMAGVTTMLKITTPKNAILMVEIAAQIHASAICVGLMDFIVWHMPVPDR
jgi:hypothetical protein